jgi:hypothetical protein
MEAVMTRIGGEAHLPRGTIDAEDTHDGSQVPLGERRAYAAPYESLTFSLVTRARRELAVTLAAQPVFDLSRSSRSVAVSAGQCATVAASMRWQHWAGAPWSRWTSSGLTCRR